jgi:hypothetical protein
MKKKTKKYGAQKAQQHVEKKQEFSILTGDASPG